MRGRDEYLITIKRYDQTDEIVVAGGLISGQVVDILWSGQEQSIKASLIHACSHSIQPAVELFVAEELVGWGSHVLTRILIQLTFKVTATSGVEFLRGRQHNAGQLIRLKKSKPVLRRGDLMPDSLSKLEARRIALTAQGFAEPRPKNPGVEDIRRIIGRLGLIQLDSVNVAVRAHFMPFFSRLGSKY